MGYGDQLRRWAKGKPKVSARPWQNKKYLLLAGVLLLWWFSLPKQLFTDPTSTVVLDKEGGLIGARIAADGQWRFPLMDSVPQKFRQCIVYYEDEYFDYHPGFNPVSILKALKHNFTHTSRRGGSTLTQQVVRLSRKGQKRTYLEKILEIFKATRLEARRSKQDILRYYGTYAPFGGNVVGLETASWRYFGLPAHQLTWGQSAALAVLPNAPSLIFPGKNEQALLLKRNALLEKLKSKAIIDETTYQLALAEPLPLKPKPLPNNAPHLVERIKKEHSGERVISSLDQALQKGLNTIAANHHQQLKGNEIHNLAILVLDIPTRKVIGYVGNVSAGKEHGENVDIITSRRSTGSILKPFLFASALDEGLILPKTLLADVPTTINGYAPKNFSNTHEGAVPANWALSRSLNIPAVRLLREYGLQKFHRKLKKMNLGTIDRSAGHYGLSLILGGAEASLWDITKTYAAMAATVTHFEGESSTYRSNEFVAPTYIAQKNIHFGETGFTAPILGAGALYHTLKALKEVNRPEGEENWTFFNDAQPIAWKTGTSYGFKDAWAVGVTPKYAIGVWAGNADGEGRPGLTGVAAAAPILFDVLALLPQSGWFNPPYDDLAALEVCSLSGFRTSDHCPNTTEEPVPPMGERSGQCPYHYRVFLDAQEQYQVTAQCYPPEKMVSKSVFTLPPLQEHYYAPKHPEYEPVPRFMDGCLWTADKPMAFIMPRPNEDMVLARDFNGEGEQLIFSLAHKDPKSKVHWYLGTQYLGTTVNFHELLVTPRPGNYILSAVDQDGHKIERRLEIK